jgi:hypothetical protein
MYEYETGGVTLGGYVKGGGGMEVDGCNNGRQVN